MRPGSYEVALGHGVLSGPRYVASLLSMAAQFSRLGVAEGCKAFQTVARVEEGQTI